MQVFDVHHHLGSLRDPTFEATVGETADHHVGIMDDLGIDAAGILPAPVYKNPDGLADTRQKNDSVAAVRDRYPDRFQLTFGTVEPWYGEAGLPEVDRLLESLDGIMWHNRWQRAAVNAPMIFDLVERAADHDAVVGLHAHAGSDLTAPWRVFDVTQSFPDVQFVVFDIFSSRAQTTELVEQAPHLDLENVVFDTALAPRLRTQLPAVIDAIGHDKIIFGSDVYTDQDGPFSTLIFEQFAETELDESVKRAIFWENAARVFDLE
ncbi:MAG: amidohydrolase family protein [Salinirussus sp.]